MIEDLRYAFHQRVVEEQEIKDLLTMNKFGKRKGKRIDLNFDSEMEDESDRPPRKHNKYFYSFLQNPLTS